MFILLSKVLFWTLLSILRLTVMLNVKSVAVHSDLGFVCTYRVFFDKVPPRCQAKFIDISDSATYVSDDESLSTAKGILEKLVSIKHIKIDNMEEASVKMLTALKNRPKNGKLYKTRK